MSAKILRADALGVANEIREAWAVGWSGDPGATRDIRTRATCWQCEIGGSLRRGRQAVGDVELVIYPKVLVTEVLERKGLFDEERTVTSIPALDVTNQLLASGRAAKGHAWGEKYRRMEWKEPACGVDVFVVHDPLQWGWIFTIRTGSGDFNKVLLEVLRERGITSKEGWLHSDAEEWAETTFCGVKYKGLVGTAHERDVFRHARIPWVPVEDRDLRPNETPTQARRRWKWT